MAATGFQAILGLNSHLDKGARIAKIQYCTQSDSYLENIAIIIHCFWCPQLYGTTPSNESKN